MKKLKTICPAAILALVLTVPAYAGEMLTPGVTAPQPSPSTLNITVDISVPEATSYDLGDLSSAGGIADILWVLASIF